MTAANILLIVLLIAVNAFFVAVEFTAVAARRARLDVLAGDDSRSARLVRAWLENTTSRERLIAGAQVGVTIVSLTLGAVGENTFTALLTPLFASLSLPASLAFLKDSLPALPLVLSLLLITILLVVYGELVPKVAVLRAPERFALAAAPFMQVFLVVFKGFVDMLDWITRRSLALAGLPTAGSHTSVFSLEEIKQMVSGPEVEGVIEQPEREMLSAIIDFGELVVRQVCTPRTEIVAVEADAPLTEIINLAIQHSLTKLPVFEDNLDQVIGVVHVRDLLLAQQASRSRPAVKARDLAREALFVPETISVNDLLVHFRARRMHLAIVLDEFGGTAGLVTLEDLLEEIVGDVQDPFDQGTPAIQPLADGSALLDGRTLIDEVNTYFGLQLASPHYDTIAGYVLGRLGRIPHPGDAVDDPANGIRLKVESMHRLRVERLLMTRI